MSASIQLEAKLDLRAAGALKDAILQNVGQDLSLDASEVNHIGALSLQVIRSAARTWAQSGQKLSFENASTDLADQLDLLGFTPANVVNWETT